MTTSARIETMRTARRISLAVLIAAAVIACGGSEEEDERMKRNSIAAMVSVLRPARARIA